MIPSSESRDLRRRPRRLRRTEVIRRLVRETRLTPDRLVLPQFILDGENRSEAIDAMPARMRLTIDRTIQECRESMALGVGAFALFPAIDPSLKTDDGREIVLSADPRLDYAVEHAQASVADPAAFLAMSDVFGPRLGADPVFVSAFVDALGSIRDVGTYPTLARWLTAEG